MHALVAGDLDEIGMEVPGVDDHPARAGIAQQLGDLDVVGFGLGERVVQHHVDTVVTGAFASISATITRSR